MKTISIFRVKKNLNGMLKLIIAVILVFIVGFPFLWMITTSFKTPPEILEFPPSFVPDNLIISNYVKVFTAVPFARFFLNSFIVAAIVTFYVVYTSTLAGYAFAKFRFKGNNLLFIITLSTMMVPPHATLVPLYVMASKLGMVDTYTGLIIPQLAHPFGVFLIRQFMLSMPDDLMDSARIEGCSEIKIFSKIIIPLSIAIQLTLAVLIFHWTWDNFVWPLVITNSVEIRTIPLGLARFLDEFEGPTWGAVMAATVVSIIPTVTLFMFAKKYFINSVVISGFK